MIAIEETEKTFRIARDLKLAAANLSEREVRYLVDFYYQAQDDRIRTSNQIRQADKEGEPHAVLSWFFRSMEQIEGSLKSSLHTYAKSKPVGRWMLSIHGIGPVITAGLMAHIDIHKAPTVGHIWRFAGLDPTVKWKKSQKRPWNASLKRLCWIIGGCFVRLRSNPKDIYGKVYEERKAKEVERNEAGAFEEQAKAALKEKKWSDSATKKCYESGKLPDGRIDLRARRYAVKLFLSHLHHVWYVLEFEKEPPKPYIIEHGGHTHFLAPPNWP